MSSSIHQVEKFVPPNQPSKFPAFRTMLHTNRTYAEIGKVADFSAGQLPSIPTPNSVQDLIRDFILRAVQAK